MAVVLVASDTVTQVAESGHCGSVFALLEAVRVVTFRLFNSTATLDSQLDLRCSLSRERAIARSSGLDIQSSLSSFMRGMLSHMES